MASLGGKLKQLKLPSVGGEKLRDLRKAARLSLVEIAARLEADPGKLIDPKQMALPNTHQPEEAAGQSNCRDLVRLLSANNQSRS